MAPLLPLVMAPNQSGFVKVRLLSDNVLLAKEILHEIGKCNPSPNLSLKVDMAKAYDRVQWPFLLIVMRKTRFSKKWLWMIERCINSCWFSILINGSPSGFFKSTRGRLFISFLVHSCGRLFISTVGPPHPGKKGDEVLYNKAFNGSVIACLCR